MSFVFILIFLVPLFPIVQDQWLNILLLNELQFSYYSVLYFLSGFLFPIIVIKNSLTYFSDYKFISNKYQSKKFRDIGYLVISTILILSILIIRYFIFSINYIISQIDLNIFSDIKLKIFLLVITMILLLINKTKRIIKKLFLLSFFINSFINWSIYFLNIQNIEILFNKYILNNSYYEINNFNLLNVFYLLMFEIFYYIWSFISYQNNLSDWSINYPKRRDLLTISEIIIFYLGVLIYYFIFNQIS